MDARIEKELRDSIEYARGVPPDKRHYPNWDDSYVVDCVAPLLEERDSLRAALDALRAHASRSPLGYVDGRVIAHRSTTDADVVEWLIELRKLVEA